MEKIIIINKTDGFYSDILKNKFSIKFKIINYCLNVNSHKTENEIINNINDIVNENDIKYLVAEGDYLSLINFNFVKKINCQRKIFFLTDDYDMHEVNFITAKIFDFIFTACPISNLRYLEKGYKSYFVPLESNKNLFKDFNIKKKFDISFFGAKKSNREIYLNYLRENNINVELTGYNDKPNYNWDDLSKFISSSKIVLNFSNTGNKNKFYSHKSITHNFFSFKGRPIIVGLCNTLCISEYSPSNEMIYGKHIPNFKNKEELLNLCKKLLSDDAYYEKIKNLFVKKSFEYEDHLYFKQVLDDVSFNEIQKKETKINLPFWYLQIFNNQRIRNLSKEKNLVVFLKETVNIIFTKFNDNGIFHIPLLIETIIKFPFIFTKILWNKFKRSKN